jgi:formylglycine-generating enzyme required for sulfatase activity
VRVTGGTFTMGEGSPAFQASPVQPNTTVGNFALDAYEVTVARFRRWVAAGRPVPSGPVMYRGGAVPFEGTVNTDPELDCEGSYSNYPRMDRENHPMNCVNWATAQAFCVWDGGRLPTQAEWEFAARGPSGRIYPWGSVGPDDTLTCWSRSEMLRTSTCPVGMFTAGSVGGIHDLAGNVWEWNADWFAGYTTSGMGCWIGASTTNALCNNRATGYRMIRGGSWYYDDAAGLRSASRLVSTPAFRSDDVGFRCARDMP